MEKLGLIRRLWNFIRRCECVEETPPAAAALSEPEQFALELQTFEVPTKKVKATRKKKRVRHLWADRLMSRITGPGTYTAKIPAYANIESSRSTVINRLHRRFKDRSFATRINSDTRVISVFVHEV